MQLFGKKSVVIAESKEPSEFFAPIGGQLDSANAEYLKDPKWSPKLFECSFGSGDFSVLVPLTINYSSLD